jgi:cell division septation protein DedD
MADIFLSYAREDESRITNLVSALEAHGWSVFWDRRIPPGETWRSYIGSALQNARCVIVAWSKHSVESQWVAEEADDAKSRGILIPTLLDRVQPPHGFREIQAADISDWRPGQPSQGFDGLISGLERRLGAQPELRQEGQHLDQRVGGGGEYETPAGSKPILSPRRLAATLAVLIAAGTIGYFAINRSPSEKVIVTAPSPALQQPPSQQVPSRQQPEGKPARVSAAGDWLIVTGSFARKDASAAERSRIVLERAGLEAKVIDTNEYSLLTPNLWAVVIGPFESRDMANEALARIKATVPDAYVKKGR